MTELPYWCARCGNHRVAEIGTCESCKRRAAWDRLENYACGVCGERSAYMFVYGFRCEAHKNQWNPSQKIEGNGVVGCVGRVYCPPEPPAPPPTYLEMIVARGFGMITCGDYLGIMVAPRDAIAGCPRGWAFIPSEEVTLELLQLAYKQMTKGKGRREKWPKNQKLQPGKKQTEAEMLETVFSSQDYIEGE